MIKIADSEYLTVKEVAKLLDIKPTSVSYLVKSGKLKAFKPSPKRTYFSEEMLKTYIEGK